MPHLKLNRLLLFAFIFSFFCLSSCSLLKKKEKCDCPTWSNNFILSKEKNDYQA